MGRLFIIPLAVLLLLAGAMVWSGGGAERRADFAFINRGDIYTLDLNQMSYMQDFRLTYGIREGLYSPDPQTYRPIPAGATRYEISQDKRTWTFHLRPEARWSNGDPVRAGDYVFSWRRMLEEPGEYTYLFYYVKNAEAYEKSYGTGKPIDIRTVGIEAVDETTLKLTLDNPVTFLLELLAFPPFYPRHEPSMRPFRSFGDSEVFSVFELEIAAANQVDRAAPADRQREQFAALVRRSVPSAEAAKTFVEKAARAEIGKLPLDQVLELLAAWQHTSPFDPASSEAARLDQMVQTRCAHYSFSGNYTRPPAVVTNGPFNMVKWDYKRRILLDKSPTYWDGAHVRSNRIEMIVSESPLSQYLLYDKGTVDWLADLSGDIAADLRAARKDIHVSPAFGTAFLTLLCRPQLPSSAGGGKSPLADVRVRQAMAMAIDKAFICDTVTRMGESPARTYLPPDGTLPDFRWQPGPFDKSGRGEANPYTLSEVTQILAANLPGNGPGLPPSTVAARQLLADAGYPNGRGFPSLPILYNTDSTVRAKIAQVLKSQWKEALNIDVEIVGIEGKVFHERVSRKDYVIATAAWYGDYPDIATFTDKYKSTSLQNDSDWINPAFDKLCEQAATEGDAGRRSAVLSEAEALIDGEVPIIPLYHYVNITMSRDTVHGVNPNPRNLTVFKSLYVDR